LGFLKRTPIDRIPLYEHFWSDTHREWKRLGAVQEGQPYEDRFDFDMVECGALSTVADLDFKNVIVEEDEDTYLERDGNGALLRHHKHHDTTPEHVDYMVKERDAWEEHIKPKLKPERRRLAIEKYKKGVDRARAANRFVFCSGSQVFEMMHPVCGHEHMLVGMALDPDWVKDMANTFAELTINLQEMLFAEVGLPDGVWYYEDMGFLQRPFMSPTMYREIIMPAHKRVFDFNKSLGLPILVHSCGFVEPLVPGMLEAGMDALQVIEVKAGMDLLRLHKQYGDRLSFMGGIDVRALYTNDYAVIDQELESKIPIVKEGFGYSLHSDHSIPCTVKPETFEHFIEVGLKLGTY